MIRLGVVAAGPAVRIADGTQASAGDLILCTRNVLTASAANEPAYEDNTIGHGLLTYHLLAALQGAPEAVTAGKLDLYQLIELVTRNVIDASTNHRKPQHPTLRGSIDGAPSWPILLPGAAYGAAFPERIRQPATSQVHSLEAFGVVRSFDRTAVALLPGHTRASGQVPQIRMYQASPGFLRTHERLTGGARSVAGEEP
jgi:hypothetical protein